MALHNEIEFENDICAHLADHGWRYDGPEDWRAYDRARALYPADVLAWIQEIQPKAWEDLSRKHGKDAGREVLDRLRKSLDSQGTLDVLRQGLELVGLKRPIPLCQFRPALGLNAELERRYAANRLRVVRQLRYSEHGKQSIDLVLFLNGIPIATAELKTDFTQAVRDAIDQYRSDRLPKAPGRNATEPLLSFPGGAVVHFAVSNREVRMTTRLAGAATRFLPFNQGCEGGAGNPVNPDGHATAYLWEEIWARDGWLEILGRYLVPTRNDKKQLTDWVFPRYHQLDCTRRLVAQVLADGPGGRYLVQHSAGSGKTKSIAWTAHFLADLHNAAARKCFDSVLVVSDRRVLDDQLQRDVEAFERTQGVVAVVKGEGASKSQELAQALSAGKKIVVCTIQTFPFALQKVQELAATEGKRFAVIADEAHSSQSGDAAAKLKAVLSAAELEELADGGEIDTEVLLAAQMGTRARQQGITYVAFTATPKPKTLQLFGTLPDPAREPGPDNLPASFHVYSMRQAIEEGFILDVLKNYTSYKMAFRIAHDGREMDDREVEQSEATMRIMGWVRLHPYNIASRVQIVVEHFRQKVSPLLEGHAKAMVVTGSRKEAVRWMLAMERYIHNRGYKIGVLVAFSGEIVDPESGPDHFTELSMDTGLKGQDIREAFATEDYNILVVANKFQTGFDQPLLCAMYVDKRLGGLQAVQTLSRLNRAHPGKDTTYVVDFVNEPQEILDAFKAYHATAELAGVTDPAVVLDLRAKLDAQTLYDTFEVERVVRVTLKEGSTQSDLQAAIAPVAERLLKRYRQAQEGFRNARAGSEEAQAAKDLMEALLLFKKDMGTFARFYTFLAQMFDYGNTDIEKRFIFFRLLLPLLEFGREREGIDLAALKLTHHTMRDLGRQTLALGQGEAPKLEPETPGGGDVQEKEKAKLQEIIARLNDLFEGELTEGDQLVYVDGVIKGKLLESMTLQGQAMNNTKEQFTNSPDLDREILHAIMDALTAHQTMSKQAIDSERVRAGMKDILLGPIGLWEALRERAGGNVGPAG